MKSLLLSFCLFVIPLSAFAASNDSTLPPGLWKVRIFAPGLTPAMANDEQTYQICYSEADAKNHVNPVLPKAEAKGCQADFMDLGDLAFDASCPDSDHRLRISQAGEDSWRGTYRYVAKDSNLMLEPAVELTRIAPTCQ
ncbi:hypothetical protein [Oryzifoliimicrobium ureilyticus]|uniref:hypothetical protein n=1 Tax=Oryzifoliimicrobium ureilyticus TaxID=3113724 RepID=UPI0030760278